VLSLSILGGRELVLALRATRPPPAAPLPSLAPTDVGSTKAREEKTQVP